MRRPRLWPLILVALLGLATNVAVVAACMWGATANYVGYANLALGDDKNPLSVSCSIYQGRGKSVVLWRPDTGVFALAAKSDPGDCPPPSWSTALDPARVARVQALPIITDDRGTQRVPSHFDIACGWPMRSFRGGVTQCPARDPFATHEFGALPDLNYTIPGKGPRMEYRTVPLDPIVPGLLVNTAMYAASWWILLFGRGHYRSLRRSRRLRRGACADCGYDRRGIAVDAACPECGVTHSSPRRGARM